MLMNYASFGDPTTDFPDFLPDIPLQIKNMY